MGFGGARPGVVQAAGLHASRLDGSPLIYNRRDPYLPDLLMCRAELADVLLDGIRSAIGTADREWIAVALSLTSKHAPSGGRSERTP